MKNAGWIALILVIVLGAIIIDFQGNNYDLIFEHIEVPKGNNTTLSKETVYIPVAVQLLKLLSNFLYALAVTLFVSIFIVRKLEKAQRDKDESDIQKLHEAININIFDALFKKLIPEEIFQVVKSEIIENKIIRKKAQWDLIFEELEDDKIKLNSTTHYQLHNISRDTVTNPISIELDQVESSSFVVNNAKCVSSNRKDILVRYDKNDEASKKNISINPTENNKGLKIDYSVEIPPNDYIESTFEFSTEYLNHVHDIQITKYPIIDLNINFIFPSNFALNIQETMSNKLRLISSGTTHRTYKVEGGILPKQGIFFELIRRI